MDRLVCGDVGFGKTEVAISIIEKLTGRNVVAFLSQAHVEPDITMEIFFIDGPMPGFGAVEVVDPE